MLVPSLDDTDTQALTVRGPSSPAAQAIEEHWVPMALGCTRGGQFEKTGAVLLRFENGMPSKRADRELREVVGQLLRS